MPGPPGPGPRTQETRPDHITPAELRRLRRYGCTRVQIGVQHTRDDVLQFVNRGHDRAAVALEKWRAGVWMMKIYMQ